MKLISKGILASLLLLITITLNAQNPRIIWKTTSWQQNIKEIAAYEANGKNYVLMINNKNGNAWIFQLYKNGKVGNQTWKTTNWEKGIECASTFKIGNQNYVFLSNGRNGHAWVIQLTADGKVGKFTWQKKKGWVDKLDEATTINVGGKTYLAFARDHKKDGKVWIADLTADGKVGKFTAEFKRSQIRCLNSFSQNGKGYLFMLSRTGKASINEITADGKLGAETWNTSGWEKNIITSATYMFGGKNHIKLIAPNTGHAWIIELTNDAKVGKFYWSTKKWEKGIKGLTSYYVNGVPMTMATNVNNGHAWTFNNVCYYPKSVSNSDLKSTYASLIKGQKDIAKLGNDLQWGSIATLKSADNISNQIDKISSRLENYTRALEGFGKVPIIGSAAVAARVTLNTSADQVNKVKSKSENVSKVAVKPTLGNANKTLYAINRAENNVLALISKLASIDNRTTANSAGQVAKVKASASQITAELNKITGESAKIKKINADIKKVKKPVDAYNKSIDKFVGKLKKVDKVVKGVNKALDKSFKKKVFGKTFKVSARKILTGGKVGKAIKKVANKWAKKLMKPLVKKLKIKLPAVPKIDKVKKELEKVKKSAEDFVNLRKGIEASAKKLAKINGEI